MERESAHDCIKEGDAGDAHWQLVGFSARDTNTPA
jgi:hypothetical protein